MRARSFFALCLLPSAISGAALVSRSDFYNFDDLNVLKCGPLPLLPLGKYKGIEFQGFQALAPNSLYPPNVPSEPCIIATTLRAELLGGLFKWQPSLPGLQLPRFTIDYANSPYASFDLVSGRFGCFGAFALGSAPVVAECDLLFTGVGLDNKDKTSVFRHVGSANEYEEIEFGTEMENVKYVRIELLDIPFANAVKAVTADNLVLTLHAKN